MKTPITKQIADKLEELAVQWKDHTSQAEALMMAAKEVMTFQEKEKEMIIDAWIDDRFPLDKEWVKQCAEKYYEQTYGGDK
jgi:hemoglobin-like flavoprotein